MTLQLELSFMMEDPYLRAIKIMEDRYDRSRKAQFAKVGEVKKEVEEIKHEFSMWKQAICRGDVGVKGI